MCRTLPAAVASLAITAPLYSAGPNTIGIIVYQIDPGRKSPMRVPPTSGSINVGAILVQRGAKIEGVTVSATTYAAPKDARKAYEKGLQAENVVGL